MKKLWYRLFPRGPVSAALPITNLPITNLPESIAYSAFLASGVEGVGEVSFAQFVALMDEKHEGARRPSGRPSHFTA